MVENDIMIEVPDKILEDWQEILDIVARIVKIPAALIMRLMEPYIQVFVASNSSGNPYKPGDKEHFENSGLYCETVIKSEKKLLVPDALADPDWRDNPDVKLNMISYLGFPIFLPNHTPFGTICVLDNKANSYSQTTERLLEKFRGIIESHLEILYVNQILGDKNKRLNDYLMELQAFRGLVKICASCKSIKDEHGNWQPIEKYLIKHPMADFSHSICPACMKKLYPKYNNDLHE